MVLVEQAITAHHKNEHSNPGSSETSSKNCESRYDGVADLPPMVRMTRVGYFGSDRCEPRVGCFFFEARRSAAILSIMS